MDISNVDILLMSQIERQYLRLNNDIQLAYYCWNADDIDKPSLILVHGTGFVAATFHETAILLRKHFRVYAYDRRGHGHSSKPDNAYELLDFAEDCVEFCQALALDKPYVVGHSAGGTDALVAGSLFPGLFSRIFVMEPTVRDPSAKPRSLSQVGDLIAQSLAQTHRRRSVFDSKTHAIANYREKPTFERWTSAALDAYVSDGFHECPDGSVELRCTPQIEAAILHPIYLTFQNAYFGDHRGDPFRALTTIQCPLAVSTSTLSTPQFSELSARMCKYFPAALTITFNNVGHCVPQEDPTQLASAVMAFSSDEAQPPVAQI